MGKFLKYFVVVFLMGTIMTLFSCVKEYEGDTYVSRDTVVNNFTIQVNDTIILNLYGDTLVVNNNIGGDTVIVDNRFKVDCGDVTVGGDTISITVEGDSIVNHLHCDVEGDNINVNGGDNNTTITNNGTGGDRGDGGGNSIDERIRRVLKKSSVWAIPTEDFPKRVRCRMVTKESGKDAATFQRFSPSNNEKCIAYYDGGSQGVTTLAYPFKMGSNVWTMGIFGSDIDKYRTIYALRIENGVASIGHWGYGEELTIVQQFLFILEEDFLLCGLPACDGNNPNRQEAFDDESQRTGRTLLGVDEAGQKVFIFIAEDATISEAFDAFAALRFCTPSRMMAVSGGSSSLGLRDVPVTAEVDSDEKIDLEKFVLQE